MYINTYTNILVICMYICMWCNITLHTYAWVFEVKNPTYET